MRIGDLVLGRDELTKRRERVARFAALPLSVRELEIAGRHIVEIRIPEDMVHCVLQIGVLCSTADDDGELRLEVNLVAADRQYDRAFRRSDARIEFREYQRSFRD